MGWRDALKSLKPGEAVGEPQDISSIDSDGPEADWFKPATNGSYVGGAPDGQFRYLRFGLNGKVYLAAGPATAAAARPLLGPDNTDPTVGQYTAVGRFTVQRKFERPIVCTVLDVDERGFDARVTSTGTATTGEYRYDFEPDES